MSLKWKTALLVFTSSLVLFSISVEILLRQQSASLSGQQELIQPISGFLIFNGNGWIVILVISLLLSIISYMISNRVALIIDELIVGISKAGGGNYNHRINSNSSDEAGQLVISYNRMLDNMLSGSQEMKEQLENFSTILDNAVEGIISINDRGVIQTYNKSAENIFGFPVDDILGKNITKLVPEKISTNVDHEIEQNFIADNLETNLPREVIGIRKSGENFPIELSVSESTINNALVFTGIIRDISERQERDLQQRKLETQLRKLQKQNSLESLSEGIAHDFNNILGPVLGYADMALAESEDGSKLHDYINNILRAAYRARELVNRIMTYSHQTENSGEHIHLAEVIEESMELLKSYLPSEHQIETYLNTSNDMILGDSAQLSQVLVALVTNASQAIGNKPGTLSIRIDNVHPDEHLLARSGHLTAGEYVCLTIEDTGEGMDTLTRAKIFEPFFSTRDKNDCSGLGLSVTYGIISSFGGDILVDSEPDKGCIFSIYLPSIEMNVSEEIDIKKNKPVSDELILYVDDDVDVATLGKEMLESLGYDVAISNNSEEALEIFSADPEDFDLVITDQSMPVLTGTQLARKLKKVRADIPVVLVSGFSASILSRELADSGIEHCIAKPVVINELSQVVSLALASSSS